MTRAAALAALLAACTTVEGDVIEPPVMFDADLGCEGTPPALEDCPRGYFFAECGGTGEPRLACTHSANSRPGDCYWFTGGCVARGFEPSTCGADEVCCHPGIYGTGGWPYPEADFRDRDSTLTDRLYGLGLEPWDRSRAMSLDLRIDAALTAVVVPAWTCEGTSPSLPPSGPCESPGEAEATLGATLSIVSQYRGFSGWNPLIEIDLETQRARVCAYFYTDVSSPVCGGYGSLCADAGEVVLDRVPSAAPELPGLAIGIDVTFPGGYHLAGSFAMP